TPSTFPAESRGKKVILRCGIALFTLFTCAAFLCVSYVVVALDLRPEDFRPGIGAPEEAEIKIKQGMTKDEVLSLLGRRHSPRDDSEIWSIWTYRCNFVGGTLFRVYFDDDDRVIRTEWWLN